MGNLESPAHLTSTSLGSWSQMHSYGEDANMGTTKNFTEGFNLNHLLLKLALSKAAWGEGNKC